MKRDELYLGVDVGGVNVRAGVIDSSGHILGQEKHRLLSKEPPQVAEAVLRAAKTACGAAGMPFSEMKGMGLGVAGMIDRGQGLVRSAPALGWRDVPFLRLLQARTPRTPLWIASELSVSAWGERAVGGGKGANDLIVVLVGATVGAGIVMAGRLHEGASGAAGELGHVVVAANGRQCSCGQRGCLEAYAGGQSLAAWARDDLRIALAAARAAGQRYPGVGRKLLDLVGEPEKVTVTAMEKAAHEGDDLSRRLLDEAGQFLGIVLANLVTTLNPARLLLGGGVLLGSPRMTRAAIAGIDAHSTKASRAALQISTPELGDEAGMVGAALLARESLAA
ncbi:MAG TPA: ROK family protein [Myxococcales bacterium]|nr:ROK family protein [Myxococcales bacterium]